MSRKGIKTSLNDFLGPDHTTQLGHLPTGPRERREGEEYNHRSRRREDRDPLRSEQADSWRGASGGRSGGDGREPRRYQDSEEVQNWRDNPRDESRFDRNYGRNNRDAGAGDYPVAERPKKLNLQKRTVSIAASTPEVAGGASNSIFGGAKPVDTDSKTWKKGDLTAETSTATENIKSTANNSSKWDNIFASRNSNRGERTDRNETGERTERGGFGGDRTERGGFGGDRYERSGFGGERGERNERGGFGGDRYERGGFGGDRYERSGYGGDRYDRGGDRGDRGRSGGYGDNNRFGSYDRRSGGYGGDRNRGNSSQFDRMHDGMRSMNMRGSEPEPTAEELAAAQEEKERLEKETLEKARLEKEEQEKARLEKEAIEKERLEKEKMEQDLKRQEEENRRIKMDKDTAIAKKIIASGKKGTELKEWAVKEHLGSNPIPGMVLMKQILESTSDAKTSAAWTKNSEYGALLAHVLYNASVESQMDALFVFQKFWFESGKQKRLAEEVFMQLYQNEILVEDAFLKWKDDLEDKVPGKMQCLIDTTAWLYWLENAQSEDDEDEEEA